MRYDAAWWKLAKPPVDEKKAAVETGGHTFDFDCNFGNAADPEVKIEVWTLSGPERVQSPRKSKIE